MENYEKRKNKPLKRSHFKVLNWWMRSLNLPGKLVIMKKKRSRFEQIKNSRDTGVLRHMNSTNELVKIITKSEKRCKHEFWGEWSKEEYEEAKNGIQDKNTTSLPPQNKKYILFWKNTNSKFFQGYYVNKKVRNNIELANIKTAFEYADEDIMTKLAMSLGYAAVVWSVHVKKHINKL